jgi:hypothetical protein
VLRTAGPRPFIEANPHLRYAGRRPEPLLPKRCWMLSKRA